MFVLVIRIPKDFVINSQSHHDKYFMFEYLVNTFPETFKYIEPPDLITNSTNLKKYFLDKFNALPDYLVSFKDFNELCIIYEELTSFSKLVVILYDIHHGKSIKRYRAPVLTKSYYILNNYGYMYNIYFPNHSGNIFFPHALAYKIDFNINPIKKILVSGHLNKEIYPDRYEMYIMSLNNNNIYYHKPDYTGYRVSQKDINKTFGKNYYNLLNKYLCCFTDDACLNRPYIVAKFFEIMGSGSLLLASNENTKEEFEKIGFIDGIHYISCNIYNCQEKIDFILNEANSKIINEIRYNGYFLVNTNHDFEYRANQLYCLLNNQKKLQTYTSKYRTNYSLIE